MHRHDLSSTLAIFRFELEGGVPSFEPGQFIPLGIESAGRTVWRAYSIASPPEVTDYVELYIRCMEVPVKGHFTSELWRMELGGTVLWKPPRGRFTIVEHLPDGSPDDRRILLVAGGTGLAPFMSMVLHRMHRRSRREIVLCHGARHEQELGYRELLSDLERRSRDGEWGDWRLRYLPTISRPGEQANARWRGHQGRVETLLKRSEEAGPSAVEKAIGEALLPGNTCIYVCGFDGTVTSVLAVTGPLGFRSHRDRRADGSFDLVFESYG